MADFCGQCVVDTLDGEFELNDFVDSTAGKDSVRRVLCEGCGFTEVNADGLCIGACLSGHFRGRRDKSLPGHVDQSHARGQG